MNLTLKGNKLIHASKCMFSDKECNSGCVAFLSQDSVTCRILLIGKDILGTLREVKNLLAKNAGR